VSLYVTAAEHIHEQITEDVLKSGINQATKVVIDHLIKQKVSSKNILLEFLAKEITTNP